MAVHRRGSLRRSDQRGSAVVDIVLVMVVLVPVVLGIMQVALVMFVRNTMAASSGRAADGADPARSSFQVSSS